MEEKENIDPPHSTGAYPPIIEPTITQIQTIVFADIQITYLTHHCHAGVAHKPDSISK